jgi:hypothetical protein
MIKDIIKYKWDTYAFYFFLIQLILMIIVTVAFIVDVAAIADNPRHFQSADPAQIVTRIICMIILSFMNLYELINLLVSPKVY